MADECELKTGKSNSKIKNIPTSSYNLNNEKLNLKVKLQKDKHASKNNNNNTVTNTTHNNSVLQHTNYTTKIKTTRKIGKINHANDRIQLEKKRNRKEKCKNPTINDDNNDNVEIKVSSESTQNNTNQDCDSDKYLFLHSKNNGSKDTSGSNLTSVNKNEVDNNMISSKCTILTSKNNAKYKKVSQSCYTFVNEKKNQEIT